MLIDVVLGLGSNLGDRENYLKEAILQIKKQGLLTNIILSSIITAKAMLPENAPQEWDIDFLNMAVRGKTSLTAQELLLEIKKIEVEIGRIDRERWAPREIDIDILVYGEEIIEQDHFSVPHKHLLERSWAIGPLAEIYPDWRYPVPGRYCGISAKDIVQNLQK